MLGALRTDAVVPARRPPARVPVPRLPAITQRMVSRSNRWMPPAISRLTAEGPGSYNTAGEHRWPQWIAPRYPLLL